MILKEGVRVRGVRPETVIGMMVADSVYAKHGVECVITSCTEGKHSWTSLHYQGAAFDTRTRDIDTDTVTDIVGDLREALGPDFDVVMETDHLHIESQPKGE